MEFPLYGASEGELQEQVVRLSQEKRDLQEYAERVTKELRRYQQSRPAPQSRPEDNLPLPPWATNMQMMSPLLFAYEERIAELETVVERSVSLAEQAQSLTKENDTLRVELHERTEQLRNFQLMAPLRDMRGAGGAAGDEPDDLAELYRLSVEQNEALAQQNQLLKLQLERMQQGLVATQRRAQEIQVRAAEGTRALTVEQERVSRELRHEQERAAHELRQEQERAARELRQERERVELLTRQRGAAEQRLEEVTGELVEEVRLRETLQSQVEGLQQELQLQGQSLDLYKSSFNDRCATAAEQEERLQADLARHTQSERDLRHRTASLEKELSEATEQLFAARREGEATKQEAERMMGVLESMERRLRDISEKHERVQQELLQKDAQLGDLQLQKDTLATSEQALRRQAERAETRWQGEVASLQRQRDQDLDSAQTAHRRLVVDLEARLRQSEQAAAEFRTQAEVFDRQRTWEAAALERQGALHGSERERLQGDLEELQQARLRIERQTDAARQENARLRSELGAASAEARDGVARATTELSACRSRCQGIERSLGLAREEMQACELRCNSASSECSRLQADVQQEKARSAELVEVERERAQAERRGLERQLQTVQVRARQHEQRATELLLAQEALRQRLQAELSLERDALEQQVDRLTRENRALREKSRGILRALTIRRGGGAAAMGEAVLGLAGGHSA